MGRSKKKENKTISQLLNLPRVLTDGVTTEKLSALYLDLSAVKYAPEPLYRLDNKGYRYYYKIDADGNPTFFTSVTTMLKNTMETPPALLKYLQEQGVDEEGADERMAYGTFLHTLCGELMITGRLSLDELPKKLQQFTAEEKIQYREEWIVELKKDAMSFAQFLIEHQVKPLGIEIILYHPIDGYAGAIDIVCSMQMEEKGFWGEEYVSGVNKGQPKETKKIVEIDAIIDIKSGRKGFYESYELQLACYREMWNIHYPDVPIVRMFNWSPKDWRSTPSYNLKDQTNSKVIDELPDLVSRNKKKEKRKENNVLVIGGTIDLAKGIEQNIAEKTLVELVKSNK